MEGLAQGHAVATQDRPERDLFVDLLRLLAMSAVVLLHWLSVMPAVHGGMVVDVNVVDVMTGLWPLTWFGDVMVLFFFVGGVANHISMDLSARRGERRSHYVARRYERLLRPTFAFLGVWLGIDLLARAVGRHDLSPLAHVSTGNTIPFGPLWFIGVYLVVIALSPLTLTLHRRWGAGVVVAMVLAVAVADAAAFALDNPWPTAVNLVLVWSVPHQLGYFYADGSLRRAGARGAAVMAAAGLVALVVLTSLPAYSRSLVSLRWRVSIIGTPSLSQVALAFWLVGLALLLRPAALRLLQHPGARRAVERGTTLTMPVYLWHMTAYLVAASLLALAGAGFVYGGAPDATWWWTRPVLIVCSGLALAALLAVRRPLRAMAHPRHPEAVRP